MINKIIWMAVGAAVYHIASKSEFVQNKAAQLEQKVVDRAPEDVQSFLR